MHCGSVCGSVIGGFNLDNLNWLSTCHLTVEKESFLPQNKSHTNGKPTLLFTLFFQNASKNYDAAKEKGQEVAGFQVKGATL
jgi:hypothetical protein